MLHRSLTGLLLLLPLTACSKASDPAAALIGAWAPQSAQMGGQALPIATFQGANLNLTADTYEFAGDSGTYTLITPSKPAQLDIHGKVGPNAGRTIEVIYELTGDQLTVCYQLGTGTRPSAFESPAGTQIFLVRYQRVP